MPKPKQIETRVRDLKATIYQDKGGKWRWRIVAGNGESLGVSTHPGYHNRAHCREMLLLVLASEPTEN
jgi:uncharacterized protein YegP (UPF0339 family)